MNEAENERAFMGEETTLKSGVSSPHARDTASFRAELRIWFTNMAR